MPRSPDAPSPATVGLALSGKILLVEDAPEKRSLLCFLLRQAGLEVDIVASGSGAVHEALTAAYGGAPYDLALVDMQTPVVHGHEATRRLREDGYIRPIIGLVSEVAAERQECLDAGCNECASKPIDRERLLQIVGRYLPGAAAA